MNNMEDKKCSPPSKIVTVTVNYLVAAKYQWQQTNSKQSALLMIAKLSIHGAFSTFKQYFTKGSLVKRCD